MSILDFLQRVEETSVATSVRESGWLFPTIETVHVISLAVVLGSIAMVDLRLLGVTSRDRPVEALMRELLPLTWGGFVVAAGSGLLLFSSAAVRYVGNGPFLAKFGLLVLAGLNMMAFHSFIEKKIKGMDSHSRMPIAARSCAAISLLLWIGIATCGRWVGFV